MYRCASTQRQLVVDEFLHNSMVIRTPHLFINAYAYYRPGSLCDICFNGTYHRM